MDCGTFVAGVELIDFVSRCGGLFVFFIKMFLMAVAVNVLLTEKNSSIAKTFRDPCKNSTQ